MSVNGATGVPFSSQPLTAPNEKRSVKVASGYTLVPYFSKRAVAISSEFLSMTDSTWSS